MHLAVALLIHLSRAAQRQEFGVATGGSCTGGRGL